MLEKLLNMFQHESIEDIYVLGFVDIEEGKAEFCPDMRCYYFKLGDKCIEFESIDQYSKLAVNIVESVQYKFEIDEDMLPCQTSVSQIVLTDSMSATNIVKSFVVNGLVCDEPDQMVCTSLQLNLANGQELFLDPSFYYGINIGGAEQRKFWRDNLLDYTNMEEVRVDV